MIVSIAIEQTEMRLYRDGAKNCEMGLQNFATGAKNILGSEKKQIKKAYPCKNVSNWA